MKRICTVIVAAFLCGASLAAAQEAIPAQPAPFRTGVEVVSVEATVLDRQGQPLRGLAAKDFTVSVAGQPRRVVSAEFVDWTPAAPPGPVDPDGMPVSTNEGARSGRLFVFVVDQNTLEVGMARQLAAATSSFFRRLTRDDRSALMVMPVGPNVELTFAHDRVRDALQRVIGTNHTDLVWDNGSLTEARDIASHNMFALRSVAERECGTDSIGAGGGGLAAGPSTGGSPGGAAGGGAAGGGNSQGGSAGSGGGATSPPARSPAGGASAAALGLGPQNECVRNIQMEADALWRSTQAVSLTTLASLHQVLSSLTRVGGEKVVILISGGLPLDDHDQTSLLSAVAADAAAARARLFTFFAPVSTVSASRRSMPMKSGPDEQMQGWSLDTLAGLTGGASFRVQVGAEGAFDRLGNELAGYYRLGVERAPSDLDGKSRSLKVQVSSANTLVRTRTMFDARTYEDRDWSARMNAALGAPSQATGLGLRLTSYVAADRDDPSRVRLVLAGEASRVADGDASFQLVIRDLEGKQVVTEEQPLGAATSERLPFSVNVPIAPGSYIVRMAVMDSAGHVGSVDHRADARKVPVGQLSAFGPLLVRLPPQPGATPVVALQGLDADERLALQLDLQGQADLLAGADVLFEVASTLDGPALVTAEANVSRDAARGYCARRRRRRGAPVASWPVRGAREGLLGRRADRRAASQVRDRWNGAGSGGRRDAAGCSRRGARDTSEPRRACGCDGAAVCPRPGARTRGARGVSRSRRGTPGQLVASRQPAPRRSAHDRCARARRAGRNREERTGSLGVPEGTDVAREPEDRGSRDRVPRCDPRCA